MLTYHHIAGKKLKRRLEDLERRAQSRSLSPNGEDTDGRSTRESSTENANASSSITTSPTPSTVSAITSAGLTSPSSVDSSPVTTTYEYSAPAYSASNSTTTTLYPSQYKTSGGLGYTSSISPTSTYVTSPLDFSQGSNTGYIYAPYDTAPAASQADMSVIDPSFILPLPTVSSSTSRIPGIMRTGGMYDIDNSVSTLSTYNLLGGSYDIQDPYFTAGGISSSYYNLDHLSPPALLNTPTHYSTSQRN